LKDILNQDGTRQFTIVTHADIRGLVTDLTYMRHGACLCLKTGIINNELAILLFNQLMPI